MIIVYTFIRLCHQNTWEIRLIITCLNVTLFTYAETPIIVKQISGIEVEATKRIVKKTIFIYV
jgi:hypothetical protein